MTNSRPLDLADLDRVALPSDPAIAPDGSRVVYVLRTVDRDADRDNRALWQVRPGGEPTRLTRGVADTDPRWSPDGRSIAFLRAGNGPAQLWLLPADGGEPEQLTELPLGAGLPVWSPDGTRIAFAAAVDSTAPIGRPATVAAAAAKVRASDGTAVTASGSASRGNAEPVNAAASAGRTTEGNAASPRGESSSSAAAAPIHIDRRHYKLDGSGMLRGMRSQVFVLDLADRSVRQVTDGDFYAGTPAWSADGERLAFADSISDDADVAAAAARVVDAGGTRIVPEQAGSAKGAVAAVIWGADGDSLVAIGAADTDVRNNGLLRIPLDGGETSELTAGFDRNVMAGAPGYPGALPQIAAGGVLFCARDRGFTHLYMRDEAGVRKLLDGDRLVSSLSVAAAANKAAVTVAGAGSFGEIVLLDLETGAEEVLTTHTATALPDVTPVPVRERVFTVSDGTEVHGWLLGDPATTPGPLLVDVHGGPHNAWNAVWDTTHAYHQVLAARGWTVLLLNPRGSDGYGETFMRAVVGGWGVADERDFLEPIDQLIAEGLADPARIALCGYSYGGYTACWLPTRTDRFAAVVTGGVVSDLVSLMGTSDAGDYFAHIEFGATYWDDPAKVAAMSPLAHVDRVTAPTLVLHGEADVRCPLGQAEQWYNALHDRGVPAELVIYPGATHLFILDGKPSHRADYNRRIIDWVIAHTRAHGPAGAATAIAPLDAGYWQRRLEQIASRHGIPGVSLAISHGDQVIEAAYGVLNVETGVETTVDSLFQIGSISKVWTATAVMRLVDQGKLDLDTPLAEILPELRLSDPDTAARITMRHLLSHTSGIDGDMFGDESGRGDDCLERYVTELAHTECILPIGTLWSYCNAGFSLAGRVIEALTGTTWDAAMRELVFEPLGLRHTVTLPEEALLYRAAVGHLPGPDGHGRAKRWVLPRHAGPAGLITTTARDVLTFAQMHLDGGVAADGQRLLSADSVRQMQSEQFVLPQPNGLQIDSWGLGWWRADWNGDRVFGHSGGTLGQTALLQVLPEHKLAFTILTNGVAVGLFDELSAEIAALAGVTPREQYRPTPSATEVEAARYTGRYERESQRLDVFDTADGLVLRMAGTGTLAEFVPEAELPLVPVAEDLFAVHLPGSDRWTPVTFHRLPGGQRYAHLQGRAAKFRHDTEPAE
ncbi:serine hydrolase [Nocardia sp. NPDC088792]|uniref:serine hydrolase n=1 Tax=Nocardia sp. NPDC088792 TaxID=3364332 RepID=UPI003802F94E